MTDTFPRPTATHGAIALDPGSCTSCNLCVVECPTWCISLDAHTTTETGPGRARKVKVLDDFRIDFGLCMYCGVCVDICPFDALMWVPEPVDSTRPLVADLESLASRWPQR